MKKRILTTLFCLAIIFSVVSFPVQARWTNCASIEIGMSYSNGTVSWTGSVEGYSDTTKITANYTLEKLGSDGKYTVVDTWTGLSTTTRRILNSSGTASGTTGVYRLTLSGTVQTATYSEPISSSHMRTFKA